MSHTVSEDLEREGLETEISYNGSQSCLHNRVPIKTEHSGLVSFLGWQYSIVMSHTDAEKVTLFQLYGERTTGTSHLVLSWTLPYVLLPLANFNLYPFPVTYCNSLIVFTEYCEPF